MTDFEKAELRLECLHLAIKSYPMIAIGGISLVNGEVKDTIEVKVLPDVYTLSDKLYNYCISQPAEKEMD